MARHHFLYSTDGFGCASLLVEIHKMRGYAAEVDLFIAQAVLQYLCLQNMSTAQAAFHCYTSQHPNIKRGPPYILPLLNFIWFLLKAVESGKLNTFKVLCEQYQPSIKRDPSYPDYLNKIGHIFFGIPLPRAQPQGFVISKQFLLQYHLGNILQSFFSGLDEESDTESEQGPQPSTSSRQHQRHAQQSSQMETEDLD
uniref:Golgi to ER traffic protein 4 homolog n=1 Tax=Timema poppense TaxID=170557 RepID=A0A7R9H6Y4_TIMPO|nr:unnamed protein product [Timema poppensis]